MLDTWKPIPGFPGYRARIDGAILGRKGRILAPYTRASGYARVKLWDATGTPQKIFVHRAMALAFFGPQPSEDHRVDHVDRDRGNNRAENLQWVHYRANFNRREGYAPCKTS